MPRVRASRIKPLRSGRPASEAGHQPRTSPTKLATWLAAAWAGSARRAATSRVPGRNSAGMMARAVRPIDHQNALSNAVARPTRPPAACSKPPSSGRQSRSRASCSRLWLRPSSAGGSSVRGSRTAQQVRQRESACYLPRPVAAGEPRSSSRASEPRHQRPQRPESGHSGRAVQDHPQSGRSSSLSRRFGEAWIRA